MSVIVDASVVVKWFVRENLHEAARALLENHGGDLEAPDLLMTEVANIAWKKAARGEIGHAQAVAIPQGILETITVFHSSADRVGRALEIALRLGHPVYDCQYLACAEAVDGLVVTADKRLMRAVEGTEFSARVALLDDGISRQ